MIDALGIGGAERVLVDSCNTLHEHGIRVAVVVLTRSDELAKFLNPEITYVNLNRTNKWNPFKLAALNKICRQFDIVQVHLRYNLRYVGLSKLIFGGNFKLLLHDHFGDIEKNQRIPFGLSFFMHRAWFVGVHPMLSEWAVNKVGIVREKAFVLPNFVVKCNLSSLTKKTGDLYSILIVSNFRESKNLTFALDLIEHLAPTLPLRVEIIGKVVEKKYYELFQELLIEKKLTHIVHLNHQVSNAQGEFWKFDLALHTAKLESGPLVLLEYLAQGLPFLAYQTGEVSARLSPHFPDFFMKNFVVGDWADSLSQIRQQDQRRVKLEMQKCYREHFGSEKYVVACKDIYETVMDSDIK